jgi:hypothetical protein
MLSGCCSISSRRYAPISVMPCRWRTPPGQSAHTKVNYLIARCFPGNDVFGKSRRSDEKKQKAPAGKSAFCFLEPVFGLHGGSKVNGRGVNEGSQKCLCRVRRRALAVALRCKGAIIFRPERHGSNGPNQMPKAARSHAELTSAAAEIFSSIIRFPSALERRSVFGQFCAQSQLRSIMVVTAAAHNSTAIMPSRQASMVEFLPDETYAVIADTFFIYLFDLAWLKGPIFSPGSRIPLLIEPKAMIHTSHGFYRRVQQCAWWPRLSKCDSL